MIWRFLHWVLNTRPVMALRHAVELDHSPCRNVEGTCPCKTCIRNNPRGENIADAFRRGFYGS